MLIGVGTYIQLISFLVSLLTWGKYKHTHLRYLPILLGANAIIEVYCHHFYRTNNVWVYNLKFCFEFNFLCFLFYHYLGNFSKKIGICLFGAFNLFFLINLVFSFQDLTTSLLTYSYVLGSFCLIIIIIMLLNEMLKVENLEGITHNLLFWISFAFFIFYATSFPIFSITNLKELIGDFQSQAILVLIITLIVMHIMINIGFLWSKRKYTY